MCTPSPGSHSCRRLWQPADQDTPGPAARAASAEWQGWGGGGAAGLAPSWTSPQEPSLHFPCWHAGYRLPLSVSPARAIPESDGVGPGWRRQVL